MHKSFGLWFGKTSVSGTHGAVTDTWATYFSMSGGTTRGWIFRYADTTNVASISGGGVLTTNSNIVSGGSIALAGSSGDGPYGISLYAGAAYVQSYGIWMGLSSVGGTHGAVTGNWACYFTMGGSNRGWIFKNGSNCRASISTEGVLTTNGDQVISSDATLKTNLKDVTYTIEDIAKTRAVTFDWKDGRGKSAGSIAQDWKPLIPELVHGEEGNMTLAYGQIALVNTILLAKHETEQDKEIARLKKEVAELRTDNLRMKSLLNLS